MARRIERVKNLGIKKKTGRLKSRTYDTKYIGPEPTYDPNKELTQSDLLRFYNWCNYLFARNDGYEFLLEFFKDTDPKMYRDVKKTDAKLYNTTTFWIARLISNGYTVSDNTLLKFTNDITNAIKQTESNKDSNVVISAQDKIKERTYDIIGDIENMIDEKNLESVYDYLKEKEIPSTYGLKIAEYYEPILNELNELSDTKDKDLKEGYSKYTTRNINSMKKLYTMIIEESKLYHSNQKKVVKRETAKKPVSIDKKLKTFKFKKEDSDLKIVSINPSSIIGAKELWMFNTKYMSMVVLRSDTGIDITGASFSNINEETSMSKRTGRKSSEYIQNVLTGGKRVLSKVMDNIKSKAQPAPTRSTADVVLLKVIK